MFDEQLLESVARLPAGSLETVVWRHTFGDNDPQRANIGGARWNPRGVDAIYASLERQTSIAEGEYRVQLEPLRPRIRRSVHKMEVRLARVLDLTGKPSLDAVGLTRQDLASTDMERTQAVGWAAERLGCDGLLVPSVRGEGGTNLVIFPNRMEPSGLLDTVLTETIFEPVDRPRA